LSEIEFKFGEGLISGYLSAFLGLLGLAGVFCFLFPEYLTTASLRASYNVDYLRLLLLAVLTLAFVFGAMNFLFEKGRSPAMVGLSSALIATLLGGPYVEVTATEYQDFTLGLDWFIISILFSALIFIPLEKSYPKYKLQKILRDEWQTDLAYFAVNYLLVSIILLVSLNIAPVFFGWAVSDKFQVIVRSWAIPVQFIAVVFIADLAQYTVHRIYHHVPLLWKMHAVHHSAKAMDWLASSRINFFEILITRSAIFLPLYLLGFSHEALAGYIALFHFQAVFIHANFGMNFGWLNYFLVTPQYHHWHHSDDEKAMDINYAVNIPIIDMLFGTFYLPKGKWPESYGIRGKPMPRGILKQQLYPFAG
jgi:sterol desaturase/sphingolipid hydroxylase (fatty acid hydroxylase superfamily)